MIRLGRIAAAALAIMLVAASGAWPQKPAATAGMPLPREGEVWRIEKIADIPPPLKNAIDRARCQLDEYILHQIPIQIFRAGRSPIALVTCQAVVGYGRAFLLARDTGTEPKPILFLTPTWPSGFGTTETPGVLDWDAGTKTLTATRGNDVGGTDEIRHTYRYDPNHAGLFTLIRVETRKCCPGTADPAWSSIWEAPTWPRLRL